MKTFRLRYAKQIKHRRAMTSKTLVTLLLTLSQILLYFFHFYILLRLSVLFAFLVVASAINIFNSLEKFFFLLKILTSLIRQEFSIDIFVCIRG